MYKKITFGKELKNKVLKKEDIIKIGTWSHSTYIENCVDLEPGLREVMIGLNTMELGWEFAISYEILNKIADDLIADKEIDLNSAEYNEPDSQG